MVNKFFIFFVFIFIKKNILLLFVKGLEEYAQSIAGRMMEIVDASDFDKLVKMADFDRTIK